jgi:hypothetical protein
MARPAQRERAGEFENLLTECAREIEKGIREKGEEPAPWLHGEIRSRLRVVLQKRRELMYDYEAEFQRLTIWKRDEADPVVARANVIIAKKNAKDLWHR